MLLQTSTWKTKAANANRRIARKGQESRNQIVPAAHSRPLPMTCRRDGIILDSLGPCLLLAGLSSLEVCFAPFFRLSLLQSPLKHDFLSFSLAPRALVSPSWPLLGELESFPFRREPLKVGWEAELKNSDGCSPEIKTERLGVAIDLILILLSLLLLLLSPLLLLLVVVVAVMVVLSVFLFFQVIILKIDFLRRALLRSSGESLPCRSCLLVAAQASESSDWMRAGTEGARGGDGGSIKSCSFAPPRGKRRAPETAERSENVPREKDRRSQIVLS